METPLEDPFDLFSIPDQADAFTTSALLGDTVGGADGEHVSSTIAGKANAPIASTEAAEICSGDETDDDTTVAATYEFRWDVEVPAGERRFGQKFMKQWKRVLQVQKMSSLVSPKITPRRARFQLCVDAREEAQSIADHEQEVATELAHLRFQSGGSKGIAGEPAGAHPAGWYGVRVWVQFNREDVEQVLGKKAKI